MQPKLSNFYTLTLSSAPLHPTGLSYRRYIEIFKSSRNEIRAYYELPRRGMGGQRPGPYDRPMMGGPRGGFFGPGPGRGGALMETMRSGGGYGGGKQSFVFLYAEIAAKV